MEQVRQEALIAALALAYNVHDRSIEIAGDSLVMINAIKREQYLNWCLRVYPEESLSGSKKFNHWNLDIATVWKKGSRLVR